MSHFCLWRTSKGDSWGLTWSLHPAVHSSFLPVKEIITWITFPCYLLAQVSEGGGQEGKPATDSCSQPLGKGPAKARAPWSCSLGARTLGPRAGPGRADREKKQCGEDLGFWSVKHGMLGNCPRGGVVSTRSRSAFASRDKAGARGCWWQWKMLPTQRIFPTIDRKERKQFYYWRSIKANYNLHRR